MTEIKGHKVLSWEGCKHPDVRGHFIFWLLTIIGVMVDLLSKWGIFVWLDERNLHSVTVIENFFYIVRVENEGAAFGIASGQRGILIGISVIALVVILGLFLVGGMRGRLAETATGLFTAGLCGNLYDRIFNNGRVRDFLDVVYWPGKHWPAFNVADSFLCIGVGLLVLSLFIGQPCQKCGQQQK